MVGPKSTPTRVVGILFGPTIPTYFFNLFCCFLYLYTSVTLRHANFNGGHGVWNCHAPFHLKLKILDETLYFINYCHDTLIILTYNSSHCSRKLFSKPLLQSFLHHFAIFGHVRWKWQTLMATFNITYMYVEHYTYKNLGTHSRFMAVMSMCVSVPHAHQQLYNCDLYMHIKHGSQELLVGSWICNAWTLLKAWHNPFSTETHLIRIINSIVIVHKQLSLVFCKSRLHVPCLC